MLHFKDISIGNKLLCGFGSLVLLAGIIAAVSYFSLQKIFVSNEIYTQLHQVNLDLAQLRRSEKDFLLRDTNNSDYFKTGVSEYLISHNKYYKDGIDRLDTLIMNSYLINQHIAPKLIEIKNYLIAYQNNFNKLITLLNTAGFKDWGLEGSLRDAIHAVENSPIHYDKAKMLMLRRNEKDYFLRRDLQYQQQLHNNADIFVSSIKSDSIPEASKQQLIALVNTYLKYFDQEVEIHKTIGMTPDIGLMGQMRDAFHELEPKYAVIMQQMAQYQQITTDRVTYTLLALILITLAIGGLLTYKLTRLISSPIKKISDAANQFGKGDLQVTFDVYSKDEIGQLAQTFRNLVDTTRDLAEVSHKIGEGLFNVEINPRSDKDVLGQSLLRMRNNLQQLDTENKRQIWIKTQIAKMTNISQGIRSLQSLLQTVICELCTTLEAGHGLFYLVSKVNEAEEDRQLVLMGSYAYVERKNISNKFKFGEGLVGQCALEKKSILLTQVPDDYIRISSGLGEKAPLTVLVLPILHEGEILGVIELAAFKLFNQHERDLLEGITNNLGIIINNVISHQRTEDLLKESQTLTEELQTQQEELRTTNEEMELKTRILKESEEKLKVQSEELQATNEELEEKTERLTKQNISIEQQNKAIEKTKQELELRAKDLAMASKYKSEFLANMSHELRTPLNSLLILSKNLQENREGNLTGKQIESARVIYSGGKDLLNLINDILDLSKVEAGRLQLAIDKISINQICDGLKSQFDPVAKDKNIAFHVAIDPNLPKKVFSDEQRLLQIIKNLLSNAFKFTSKGYVTLKISQPDPSTQFKNKALTVENSIAWSVTDTGIGIPKDKQTAIFEAFQQADGSTSRNYGGTGLGLTISRALAALLGGEISLKSREGEGSIFTLYLPIEYSNQKSDVEYPLSEHKKIENAAPVINYEQEIETIPSFLPDDREKFPTPSKSLLIIEDDKKFASILIDVARKKGYLCLAAGDGQSGFTLAKSYQPTAIILDLGLPDVDGQEILAQLKFDLKTRHIPVHVISAREEIPEIRQKGAIGYLTKPTTTEAIASIFSKIESVTDTQIRHVLVVEDDANGQQAIIQVIDNPHIQIECVATAANAKEHIIQQNYDCIILDLNLPDRSGFELLQSLKDEKINLPPIVIYTGRELTEEEHNSLRRYSASIIVKGADSPERLLDELSLFLHSVEADLPEEQKKTIQLMHNSNKTLMDKRILIVDDDMRNVFALSSVLEERGLDILIASNGKVALEKLKDEKDINLILMDIMMPVMDGYEAMRQIRSDSKYKNLPIVALTAKAMPEDKEKCLEAGANDYITKPVDTDQLVSMMEVWLSK